jgi:hypothetical protein
MNNAQADYVERYSLATARSPVAIGSLFWDKKLQPGEVVSRTIVFSVPKSERFEVVEVKAEMPSIRQKDSTLVLSWSVDKDWILNKKWERRESNGQLHEINESNTAITDKLPDIQIQRTSAELLLFE